MIGTSLLIQRLRLCASIAGAPVWSLVGELRSRMLRGDPHPQKIKEKREFSFCKGTYGRGHERKYWKGRLRLFPTWSHIVRDFEIHNEEPVYTMFLCFPVFSFHCYESSLPVLGKFWPRFTFFLFLLVFPRKWGLFVSSVWWWESRRGEQTLSMSSFSFSFCTREFQRLHWDLLPKRGQAPPVSLVSAECYVWDGSQVQ